MRSYLNLLALVAVCSMLSGPVLAEDQAVPADTAAIATPQQALDVALSFVGLQMGKQVREVSSLSEAVQKLSLSDTAVPFYRPSDTILNVWEVRLSLTPDSLERLCSRFLSCKVKIDAATGAFLEARLTSKDSAASIELQPADYWEDAVSRATYSFGSLMAVPPVKPLSQALETGSPRHPCSGTEIVAWCLQLVRDDGTSIPFWCVVGRNSRFLELHRPKGAPSLEGRLVNYLSLINANTGELWTIMN